MSPSTFLQRKAEKNKFSVPSRELILAYLAKREQPVSCEELASELKLNISAKNQLDGLRRRLRAMARDAQLIFTRQQCYYLPERLDVVRGTVIGHRDGFGFLRVEGSKNDYYLSVEQMKMVIHGDIALAQPQSKDQKNRREARIVQVLVPKNSLIVGRFLSNHGSAFVVPNDSRLNFNILIPPEATNGSSMGCVVVVKLTQRPTKRTKAIGKVVEVLGNNMGTSMIVDIALRNHDIPYFWPPEVEQQIAELKEEVQEEEKYGRIDLRALPFVTIDGEDARDFDDAVYCETKRNGGWRLWVAISDVSCYVRPHTPLDQEASRRATSIYFPSQVIPMLPEALSNGLCSLNPKMDRLCMVCEMTISAQGRLSSYKFYEAVINSHARLTYNIVWNILQSKKSLHTHYLSLIKSLMQLHEMYQTLEQANFQLGSLYFEIEEAKFIFNAEHRIARIEPVKRNNAHKLIEQCMILANIAAARFVEKHQEPALYRVHERPNNDNITSLRTILGELGMTLGGGDKPEAKDYANLLNQVYSQPNQELLQTMLLRSMKQAIYAHENRGHFGLSLQAYTHFTSPIRRYPDLTLHRAIKYIIGRQNGKVDGRTTPTGGWHAELEEILTIGKQCSLGERRADEATRNVADWLKCDFMQDQVGKVFQGIITSVTSFGFFVRLNNMFIDGLVHISSLYHDYYRYDNIGQRLIGELYGKIYRLGDAVEIYVKAVHMEERKIDFSLIASYHQPMVASNMANQCQQKTKNKVKTSSIRNKYQRSRRHNTVQKTTGN